jgi:acyl-CoA thioesterase-1
MVAAWLLWSAQRTFRETAIWPILLGCAAIVLVKRVTLTPTVLVLVSALAATALLDIAWTRRQRWTTGRRWFATIALACIWLFLALDWQALSHRGTTATLAGQRPIVCLGDSLTSGVRPFGGYPDRLQELISVPVVNFGRAGITSVDGLKQLPAIIEIKPQAVVIEIGGHDYLLGHSRSSTKANIVMLIEACREINAEVILVEIPRGFITDPFAGLEREIAREHDVEILADGAIRQLVLWSPVAPPGMWTDSESHLSDDGLHPNEMGNIHLAQCVAKSLQRIFGREILHESH